MAKLKIKTGDKVEIISGKDKGKQGTVIKSFPSEGKVVVEGVAVAKRHTKPNAANQQGGIIEKEMPIDISNVAIVDPQSGKPSRIGYKFLEDGSKVRISKASGSQL